MIAMLVLSAQLSTNIFLPRFGPKAMVPIGMLLAMSGMLLLTLLDRDSQYAANVLPALMLLGLDGLDHAAVDPDGDPRRDREFAGVASAMVNTSQQVGGSIGTALLNTLAATAAADFVAAHAGHPRCARGCGHPQLRHGVLVGRGRSPSARSSPH
jgi:nitrate/nitrite transporter NarK